MKRFIDFITLALSLLILASFSINAEEQETKAEIFLSVQKII